MQGMEMNKDSYHSMKRGLALSLGIHVIFIIWGAISFINPVSLPQQLEVIPITLAPLSQELSSQQGAVDAPLRAIPAVKPTIQPQEKEDARHVGEGEMDSLMPFKEKEKPRFIETASSLLGQEKTPEKPLEELTKAEREETKIEALPERLEQKVETVAEALPERLEQKVEAVAEALPERPEQKVEAVAEALPERLEQKVEAVAEALPERLEQKVEAVAEALPERLEQKVEAVAEALPERLEQKVEAVAEALPERPEQKVEAVTEALPERLEQKVEAVAEVLPERPEQKVEAVTEQPLEIDKNEEVISPQKLAPMVKKTPVEQEMKDSQKHQIVLPEKPLLPQLKPKSAKDAKMQSAQARNKKNQQMNNKTIEDILAIEENDLLNRAHTQGGGAKRSNTPEALGARKNIDDITKMAQTLVTIVGGCIQQKLKLVALGGDLKNRPVVRLRFTLNREGMVMGEPVIEPLSGAKSQQTIMMRQVYAAVFSCQPYADLPRDQYDLWGQGFDFNVDPLQEITR